MACKARAKELDSARLVRSLVFLPWVTVTIPPCSGCPEPNLRGWAGDTERGQNEKRKNKTRLVRQMLSEKRWREQKGRGGKGGAGEVRQVGQQAVRAPKIAKSR
jgi:hypothetical protein